MLQSHLPIAYNILIKINIFYTFDKKVQLIYKRGCSIYVLGYYYKQTKLSIVPLVSNQK